MKHNRLFPFEQAMAFAFGILHLPPHIFWLMTPRELNAAASVYQKSSSVAAMDRKTLSELMRLFPD